MATLYKTDGSVEEVRPKDGEAFSLEELRGFVGEGRENNWLQIVPLPDGKAMVVNDEGKLIGLPYNAKASEEWKRQYPIEQYPHNNDETIVGNALVATEAELGN